MTPYRLLLAHPKNLSDEEIDALSAEARGVVKAALPDRDVSITPGRDEYAATFRRCGTWEAWARNAATGVEYGTGLPRYHAIIVAPAASVGRATAGILRHAIAAGKPVFLLAGGDLMRVLRLDTPEHGGDYYTDAICVT
jgi:hypothetical protein